MFIHELFGDSDCLVGQEFFVLAFRLMLDDLRVSRRFQKSQILFIIYVIYSLLYFFILLFKVASNQLWPILFLFSFWWFYKLSLL
jgi:hypothetical protein